MANEEKAGTDGVLPYMQTIQRRVAAKTIEAG